VRKEGETACKDEDAVREGEDTVREEEGTLHKDEDAVREVDDTAYEGEDIRRDEEDRVDFAFFSLLPGGGDGVAIKKTSRDPERGGEGGGEIHAVRM